MEQSNLDEPSEAQVSKAQSAEGACEWKQPNEEAESQRIAVEREGITNCTEKSPASRPAGSRLPEATAAGDSG